MKKEVEKLIKSIYRHIISFPKRKPEERIPFKIFVMDLEMQGNSKSLEDALVEYIQKYDLAVQQSPDEPKIQTLWRARLRVLEESMLDPEFCTNKQIHDYIESTRIFVSMFDSATPEFLRHMKEKENNK